MTVPERVSAQNRSRGSATVLVLGAVAVLLVTMVGGLCVVSAVVAAHRAHSAADLAALAAAAALVAGESSATACGRGAAVAAGNRGYLTSCTAGPDFTAELVVQVDAAGSRVGTATARSRAGPAGGQ